MSTETEAPAGGLKIVAWVMAALLLGTAIYFLFLRPPAGPAVGAVPAVRPSTPVFTANVVTAPAADTFRAVGTLLADESVVIRSEIAGRIASLNIEEGGRVEQGQILARLADEEWIAMTQQSEATLLLQDLKMKRAVELREKKVVSQQEYDETQAALDQARASLALARARLDKTVIRAPFSGIIGLRRVSPGDYLQAGQELVNLEAINPLKVDFSVPERFAMQLQTGQVVHVRINAFSDETFEGEVFAINPRIEETTRSFLLRARIANPDGRLRPGMFADAELVLMVRNDALWIPEQAIVPVGERHFVYRIEGAKAWRTEVQMGLRISGQVEIINGLEAGAVVVSEGQQKLQDGADVTAVSPAAPGRP